MKTKHLFLAMALPVAFAACTSEELVESVQNQNLDARKALGDVELAFGEGVDSRLAVSEAGAFIWSEGDGVGACLVDVYVPTGDEDDAAIKNYKLTDYIQTNYQYKRDAAGKWTTTARMVEGNYMFYAPYNGNHLARTSIMAGAPTVQNLSLNEDGSINQYSALDEFVKSGKPAYVGYKFLAAEGQENKVAVNLKPIYAYPEITIDNTNLSASEERDLTITKVVITYTGGFEVEAPITIGTKDAVAAAATEGVVGMLFDNGATADKNGAWITNNKNMKGNRTSQVTGDAKKENNVVTINMPDGAYTVAVGETVKFNIVLPAEAYSAATTTIYAYTAEGKAIKLPLSSAFALSTGKIYVDGRYKADGTFSSTMADPLKVKNVKAEALVAAPNIVYTTEELETLVASASADVDAITFANDEVKLTAAVADAAANTELSYTIDSPVSIIGGTAEKPVAVNKFTFNNGATIESGVVTVKGNTGDIEVEEGAILNINDGEAAAATLEAGTITNYGTVNVYEKLTAEALILKSGSTLNVEVADNAQAAMKIDFDATETDADDEIIGATLNLKKNFAVDAALTVDEGSTSTISSGAVVTVAAALTNNGSMTNNGTIKGDGSFVNGEDASLINAGVVVAKTITNNGDVTNNKYFGLDATSQSTTITNEGTITMGLKTARAFVNAGEGEIDNTALGKVTGTNDNVITVTITEDMTNYDVLAALGTYTKIYLNGGTWTVDLDEYDDPDTKDTQETDPWITNMTAKTLVLNGGSILLDNQDMTFAAVEVQGTSTIYGDAGTETLTSTAAVKGAGTLSLEFANFVGKTIENADLASTENVTLYVASATTTTAWVGTANKTTTLMAAVPTIVEIAENKTNLVGKIAASTNVTINVTGYMTPSPAAPANANAVTKAEVETAFATILAQQPKYLKDALVSGTVKAEFENVIFGTVEYTVVLSWDATGKKWTVASFTKEA